jgi:hypothetical protein
MAADVDVRESWAERMLRARSTEESKDQQTADAMADDLTSNRVPKRTKGPVPGITRVGLEYGVTSDDVDDWLGTS